MTTVKNKKIAKILALLFISAPVFVFGKISSAQGFDFRKATGLDRSADEAGFQTGSQAATVDSFVSRGIFVFLGLVGVIFLGLMIYAGIMWMIAQGNEDKVARAKDTLLNALIGLIITLSAYAISYLVVTSFQ